MITLLASHNEELYRVEPRRADDFAHLVRGQRLQVLSSTDGTLDFWFIHHPWLRVNRRATVLLMGITRFTARDVPLLRGNVVIATHDAAGQPASLDDDQMMRLVTIRPSWREDLILRRRLNQDLRARQQIRAATEAAARKASLDRAFGEFES